MKKTIISLIVIMIMVVFVGACSPTDTPDYVTQEELNEVQAQLNEVQSYLDRMVWVGYMLPETDIDLNNEEVFYVSRLGLEYLVSTESDLIDWSKFPDYILDLNGDYISVDDLGNMLTQKYFGIDSTTIAGFQYKMTIIKPIDMSQDDFVIRLSMMIIELSYYDFYTLGIPELYIVLNEGASSHIKIRMSILNTDKYDGSLVPAMFYGGLMDAQIMGLSFNAENVELLYAQYILDETYFGFVLPNY
ncbi:MAG: hypothetical protein GQ557_02200 [Mycoplasmataceae bacterium]|nr:hypothetical protein [Mycoplasmataceae bacterium]